jgi:hypothetical protein
VAMAEILSGLRRRAARRAVTRGSNGQRRWPEAEIQTAKTAKGGAGFYHKDTKTQRCRAAASRRTANGAERITAKSARFARTEPATADAVGCGSRFRTTIVDSEIAGGNLGI